MKKFALIGASGYIAPRHMMAIQDSGNSLVAALDPNDSVGIIDSYFPDADFFTEYERFDRHIDLLRRNNTPVDYISICSPNYLHDSHIRFALRSGANAICEKPVVLNPKNLSALIDLEKESAGTANTILQLRLHDSVNQLRDKVQSSPSDTKYDVDVTYVTSRGRWYEVSWKGDDKKSGGIATNIGVHFYDMLHYVFGPVTRNVVHHRDSKTSSGYLEFEKARVRWFLSVESRFVPKERLDKGVRTYRSITVNGKEFEFSGGFTDLHTRSYEAILAGKGFDLSENMAAIEIVADIRNSEVDTSSGEQHHLLNELYV